MGKLVCKSYKRAQSMMLLDKLCFRQCQFFADVSKLIDQYVDNDGVKIALEQQKDVCQLVIRVQLNNQKK